MSKPFTDPRIQQFDMTAGNGETYQISLYLPANWGQTETPHQLVLVTDADILFTNIAGGMPIAAFEIPALENVLVAAIGYGGLGVSDRTTFLERRTNDFTQCRDEGLEDLIRPMVGGNPVATGGADTYLAFIEDMLLPHLDSAWNASPERRVMYGGSLGANFALYCLFQRPALFSAYLLFSPAIGVGLRAMFEIEEQFSKANTGLPVDLQMFMGEHEEVARYGQTATFGRLVSLANFLEFSAQLAGRGYEGLKLKTHVLPDAGHFEAGFRGTEILLNQFLPRHMAG